MQEAATKKYQEIKLPIQKNEGITTEIYMLRTGSTYILLLFIDQLLLDMLYSAYSWCIHVSPSFHSLASFYVLHRTYFVCSMHGCTVAT